eukprot:4799294-Amphidinium_carterae.1
MKAPVYGKALLTQQVIVLFSALPVSWEVERDGNPFSAVTRHGVRAPAVKPQPLMSNAKGRHLSIGSA